ncbi:MAG: RDD family protein [Acidimicrobiaceae bacterium]|nr:RDD family protein [Acidimicrobiaceae bacterium]
MSDHAESASYDGSRRTGWAELGSGETVELARPLRRLGARILDAIVAGILLVMLLRVSGTGVSTVGSMRLGLVVGIGYEVSQVAVWGQTIGKRMTGIRVINAVHGGVPGWGKAFGRWAIPGLVALIPILGPLLSLLCYVSLTWDRVYQGWHDKVAGTLVIKT